MYLSEVLSNIGRPVAYYPGLNAVTGSVNATIFMSQFLFWSDKALDPNGWIYKTQVEIENETGLSRFEQEGARRPLKKLGILLEKFRGMPRKKYYKIDSNKLNILWNQHIAEKQHHNDEKTFSEDVNYDILHDEITTPLYTESTTESTTEINTTTPISNSKNEVDSSRKIIPKLKHVNSVPLWDQHPSPTYEIFYKSYPKHEAKTDGWKAWCQVGMEGDIEKARKAWVALENQKSNKFNKKDKEFVPLIATWLRGKRWEDEIMDKSNQGPEEYRIRGQLFRNGKPAEVVIN